MYVYYLNLTMADKKIEISNEMYNAIEDACKEAETTTNSIRHGRKFKCLERINDHSIKLKLESQTEVIPTRSISSITRAILRSENSHLFENHLYKGSILNATLDRKEIPSVSTPDDYRIIQEVIQIFFGKKDLDSWQRKVADEARKQIRETVTTYLGNI